MLSAVTPILIRRQKRNTRADIMTVIVIIPGSSAVDDESVWLLVEGTVVALRSAKTINIIQ